MNLNRPKSVRLEACTICQLKCKCCYMRNSTPSVGFGYLKFEDFKNFIEKNNYIKSVELSNSGEIFLNPDLLKIIKYSYENNIELSAYNGVNFNTVSEDMLEALVKYKFSRFTVSIDGASQETYEKYRVGGNFETVISNIKKLNEFKKKYNSQFPKIKYQFIIFGHNEHEILKAKKLAGELNCEINFKFSWDENFSPIKNPELVKKQIQSDCSSATEYTKKKKKVYLKQMCTKMWTQPQINWDGRLLGCCCIHQDDYGVNVFETDLESALTSKKIMLAKQMVTNKIKAAEGVPCTNCGQYKAMCEAQDFVSEEEILEFL